MKHNCSLLRASIVCYSALLLCACNALPMRTASTDPPSCVAPDNATGLRLQMIGQQMSSGQYHAALAHLDTVDKQLPQAQLMRARALRAINDSHAAAAKYRTLLDTCLAAYAHQGLGIVAADRRDMNEALTQLQSARQLAPVDADIRNDYGFVLLAAGRVNDSLRELRTAVELETGNAIAARNLVLALFIARRDDEARATGHSHAFSADDIDALAARARGYKPLAVTPPQKSADNTAVTNAVAHSSAVARTNVARTNVARTDVARTNIIVRHTRKSADTNAALVDIPVNPPPMHVEPVNSESPSAATVSTQVGATPINPATISTEPITPKTVESSQSVATTVQEVSKNETH